MSLTISGGLTISGNLLFGAVTGPEIPPVVSPLYDPWEVPITFERKLDAATNTTGNREIAISGNGQYAIVSRVQGVPGKAYVFMNDGNRWRLMQELTPDTPTDGQNYSLYGRSVDISYDGSIAIVGDPQYQGGRPSMDGGVFVFTRTNTTWTQQQILLKTTPDYVSNFGTSISINSAGNRIIVGAPANNINVGSVHVFEYTDTWTETHTLAASNMGSDTNFGRKIKLSDDGTMILASLDSTGASGDQIRMFMFTDDWAETETFIAPTIPVDGNQSNDYGLYGIDISSDNLTFVVGAPGDHTAGLNLGAAYIYKYDTGGSAWLLHQTITYHGKLTSLDKFGESVAISADGKYLAVVMGGEPTRGSDPDMPSTSIYEFNTDNDIWEIKSTVQHGRRCSISDDGMVLGHTAIHNDVDFLFTEGLAPENLWRDNSEVGQHGVSLQYPGFNEGSRDIALSGNGHIMAITSDSTGDYGSYNQLVLNIYHKGFTPYGDKWTLKTTITVDNSYYTNNALTHVSYDGKYIVLSFTYYDNGDGLIRVYKQNSTSYAYTLLYTTPRSPNLGGPCRISDDGRTVFSLCSIDNQYNGRPASVYYSNDYVTWPLQQTITLPNNVRIYKTAQIMSGDGNTIVIGDESNDKFLIYYRTGSTWALEHEIVIPDQNYPASPAVCNSTSLSYDGNTLVISSLAFYKEIGDLDETSAIQIFNRSGGTWSSPITLYPPACPYTDTRYVNTNWNSTFGTGGVSVNNKGNLICASGLHSLDEPLDNTLFIYQYNPDNTSWELINHVFTRNMPDDTNYIAMSKNGLHCAYALNDSYYGESFDVIVASGVPRSNNLRCKVIKNPDLPVTHIGEYGFNRSIGISSDGQWLTAYSRPTWGSSAGSKMFIFKRSGNDWVEHQVITPRTNYDYKYSEAVYSDDGKYLTLSSYVTTPGYAYWIELYELISDTWTYIRDFQTCSIYGAGDVDYQPITKIDMVPDCSYMLIPDETDYTANLWARTGDTWAIHSSLSIDSAREIRNVALSSDALFAVVTHRTGPTGRPIIEVFSRVDTTWTPSHTLTRPNNDNAWVDEPGFGVQLRFSGDDSHLFVGDSSIKHNTPNTSNEYLSECSGGFHVYTRSANTWSFSQSIRPNISGSTSYSGKGVRYGGQLMVSSDMSRILLGSIYENTYDYTDPVTFAKYGSTWVDEHTLISQYSSTSHVCAMSKDGSTIATGNDNSVHVYYIDDTEPR